MKKIVTLVLITLFTLTAASAQWNKYMEKAMQERIEQYPEQEDMLNKFKEAVVSGVLPDGAVYSITDETVMVNVNGQDITFRKRLKKNQ